MTTERLKTLFVKVSDDEKRDIRQAAGHLDLTPAEYCRRVLLGHANDVLLVDAKRRIKQEASDDHTHD